jgi:hypothetical protein
MKTNKLTDAALDWAVGSTGEYGCGFFSTDWSQGGPIIEACMIDVGTYRGAWRAARHVGSAPTYGYGPTPLIAAMRCYVASKLGDEIELPTELGETK